MDQSQYRTIRDLNDEFRKAMGQGGHFVMTVGVLSLPGDDLYAIAKKVESYGDFTEGDDPYGEHDFGVIVHNDRKIFWKIDYYDTEMKFGSEDPANPAVTTRVLTVMLAEEY